MKPIKNKSYYNFMRVLRLIEKKGYKREEAERIAHRIFDQYEAYPQGLSVLAMIEQIEDAH